MTTRIDEIADGIYRISTPVPEMPGGFSFNQYLVKDDEPLLFHTGGRRFHPAVREAIGRVLPVKDLRWIGFSHHESDENGAMNEFLADAPNAQPLCSHVAALVQMNDLADRPPRALADGETIAIGKHRLRWLDTPHLPHGWDCGYVFDETTRTLFCGDLFTQPGLGEQAVTEGDILGPSEAFRSKMDYYSGTRNAAAMFEKLVATEPRTLACMHGSAWRGDGAKMLRALASAFG